MFAKPAAAFSFLCGMFGVWYGYAPEEQRAALPDAVRVTADRVDRALSDIMPQVASLGDARLRDQLCGALAGDAPILSRLPEEAELITGIMTCAPEGEMAVAEANQPQGLEEPSRPTPIIVHAGHRVSLRDGALPSLTFTGAALAGVDALEADLSGAIFRTTDLRSGVFDGATLSGAVISGSALDEARFYDADANGLIVDGGTAQDADFRGARLHKARFVSVDLSGSRWHRADLTGASFVGTSLSGASFRGADLSRADLSRALGLNEAALAGACGDVRTQLPGGLRVPHCALLIHREST